MYPYVDVAILYTIDCHFDEGDPSFCEQAKQNT